MPQQEKKEGGKDHHFCRLSKYKTLIPPTHTHTCLARWQALSGEFRIS
jgi:hypothetical protein